MLMFNKILLPTEDIDLHSKQNILLLVLDELNLNSDELL